MASKKGIIITIIILAVITSASFLVWTIPHNTEPTFVISNYKDELDRVKDIQQSLESSIDAKFDDMKNDSITPDEYIQLAQATNSQINAQIIELVESGAPEEWQESYIHYIDALKKFNDYTRETIVVANMKKDNSSQESIQSSLEKIQTMKQDMDSLITQSDEARP